MEPSRFDELTKALATTTSRRQALKTIAAATIGSLLGLGGGDLAFAKNKTCAQWCASVFGDNTAADEQCAADAAHHTGLCYTCGPASPGGTQSICCPQNSDGTCTSYSSATCCGRSATCLNGSCCPTANVCGSTCLAAPCDSSQCLTCDSSSGTCVGCPQGQTCQDGTCCIAGGGSCSAGTDCCSGNCCQGTCCDACSTCQGGTCVSACTSGQVCLSNGTCATPCPSEGDICSGSCGAGLCTQDNSGFPLSGSSYCENSMAPIEGSCSTDSECPKGYFCFAGGACAPLC